MTNETTAAAPTPSSLDAWVKHLDAVDLPIPLHSHALVCKALNDDRRSLREIAEVMQDSPALALSLIREANRHAHGSLSEPSESLEVAINRLGLKRTQELLERLPALATDDIPLAFRQIQLISQHAAQQASGLFGNRLARLWHEIYWGSLLFLSPLWAMALTHPQQLGEWEHRVIHKGECASKVEKQLFGVRLFDICRTVAALWRLPEWVLQGYAVITEEQRTLVSVLHIARDIQHPLRQQQRLDANPALRRWLNQPANTVLLANGLALSAQQAWDSPHNLRWQYLTSLYLQMPLDELQQQVHQHAASSARYHSTPDLWHPAQSLLWPWDMRRASHGLPPAAPPSAEALVLWRKYCGELLTEPSVFSNAMHLSTCARDALLACGMSRVMLLMADKTASTLRAHQIAGLPKAAFDLNLLISQSSALQRLMLQPAQVRLTPENNSVITAVLPESLRSLFQGEHLLLRSLSSNGRVVMLVVADQGGGPFSETSVQAFGKTAQCIEKALNSFTTRGR
ncbi:MAG: HDOD domain-containing protein [Pseudomonadota bacterium]